MSIAYTGQIILFAGNFTIRNYAQCDGQSLSISQYSALYSILGTTYGGNGMTTFNLPDLRGRVPIHYGTGPGLSPRNRGSSGGAESVTLNSNQMPVHTHTASAATTVYANNSAANTSSPQGNVPGNTGRTNIYQNGTPNAAMNAGTATTSVTLQTSGLGQSHENMPPFVALNYQICLNGWYPTRS